jgi:hypothetical protein
MNKFWTLLSALFLLSGCLGPTGSDGNFNVLGPKGNGEGYGGNKDPKVIRAAYQVDPQASCSDGSHPGYQSKIEVHEDGSMVERDACGGEARGLTEERTDSLGDQIVGYKSRIYEFRAQAPQAGVDEPYFVTWCQAAGTPAQGFLVRSTTQTHQKRVLVYTQEAERLDWTDPFEFRIVIQPGFRLLLSDPLEAIIGTGLGAVLRNRYVGKMRYEGEDRSIVCRLLPGALN